MRLDFDCLAQATVNQNPTPGGTTEPKRCFQLSGVTDGAGGWTFTGSGSAQWDVNMEDIVIDIGLQPGSNILKGISWGLSVVGANQFSVTMYRNDTGAAVDIPFYVVVWRKKVVAWD